MITKDFEKLGAFYLGRTLDPATGERLQAPVLYDARDLTTHGLLIGMTGSGKTGLATALIEEAILDGIPVLAIDPKGDLGNLFLSFPELQPDDFLPWIDPVAAGQKGLSSEEFAKRTAAVWQQGLSEWGQDGERIRSYINAAERKLYTPGSRAGTPLSLLSTLSLPKKVIMNDEEALRDRIQATASGLLALLGIEADPMQSREHILLSILLDRSWRQGSSLDLAALIMQIQAPPVERVGILALEAFFPKKDRAALAIGLNNLLASPGFEVWMEGEPMDAGALLFNDEGKPRLSVVSISHLNDNERMFVVTCLLNSLISWMRSQPGSGSLRALVYMDEIYGYLPPVASPPSKVPLLTLLKQARAFGIGLTLATQNPVDLDYKALANAGTWFLGRLQTERDKNRVIDGLQGAATGKFDRGEIESLLGRLDSRQFLLHNVHEDMPVTFETRWVLNYLAGPLTRSQIQKIAAEQTAADSVSSGAHAEVVQPIPKDLSNAAMKKPPVPENLAQGYAALNCQPTSSQKLTYRPFLLAICHVHYSHQRLKVDEWHKISWLTELNEHSQPWREAKEVDMPELCQEGIANASYTSLPKTAASANAQKRWQSQLKTILYQRRKLVRFVCKDPKAYSQREEQQAEFRSRLLNLKREQRDIQIEKLRQKYTPRLSRVQEQIMTAEQRLQKEQQQVQDKKVEAGLSLGATLIGAFFGRKLASASNISRASRAVRGTRRIAKEKQDVAIVQQKLATLQGSLAELEQQFEDDIRHLQRPVTQDELSIATEAVSCRKTDTDIEEIMLLWVPFLTDKENGATSPAAKFYGNKLA